MAFSDEFQTCMNASGLPTPAQGMDSADEVLEFLDRLHQAWEDAGGETELALGTLVTAGAVTGIDEEIIGGAAAVLVSAYIGACIGCLIGAAGSSVWDALASVEPDERVRAQVVAAAETQGISPPEGVA
ncbi:hypothetical protein [Streptomyces sp. NPDC004783]|uniref:hypothetical protein n=1 Tax=Streptomyces sp. NPDC004783 TaxID=3154459 RepID=UPI0033A670AF